MMCRTVLGSFGSEPPSWAAFAADMAAAAAGFYNYIISELAMM